MGLMLSCDSARKKLVLFFFICQGTINFKNGDKFKGEFHHNEIQGIGELTCVSGLMYQGEWRHSKVIEEHRHSIIIIIIIIILLFGG